MSVCMVCKKIHVCTSKHQETCSHSYTRTRTHTHTRNHTHTHTHNYTHTHTSHSLTLALTLTCSLSLSARSSLTLSVAVSLALALLMTVQKPYAPSPPSHMRVGDSLAGASPTQLCTKGRRASTQRSRWSFNGFKGSRFKQKT